MVSALALTAALAWSEFNPPDSSTIAPLPQMVNLSTVVWKTVLLPSWGAWEGESPTLAGLELLLDFGALYLLRDAPNLHGENSQVLLLVPAILAFNRLLSLPLNIIAGYGELHTPPPNGKAFGPGSKRLRMGVALLNGGFGARAIGIGGPNLGLGILFQFETFRLMPYGYFPNGLSADRSREPIEPTVRRDWWLYGLAIDRTVPLFSWLAATQGANLNLGRHQEIQNPDSFSNFPPHIENEIDFIFTPKLGLRMCPFTNRVQLEVETGLNFPIYRGVASPNQPSTIRGADFKIQASAWF